MKLYDEAIKHIKDHEVYLYSFSVIQALERAKKVAELLGLYQKKENCIVCVPLMKDSNILHCVVRYSEDEKYMRILKQIKALEEELK